MTGADEQRRTNDRDELARRVAQKFKLVKEGKDWYFDCPVFEKHFLMNSLVGALLSAEQRLAEAEARADKWCAIAQEYGCEDQECLTLKERAEAAERRVAQLEAANHRAVEDCLNLAKECNAAEQRVGELEEALRELLSADGHLIDCKFRGCSCGRIELYARARGSAVGLVRAALSPKAKEPRDE